MAKKKKRKAKFNKYIFWGLLGSLTGTAAVIAYFFVSPYFKAPVIDETKNMVTLPPEMVHVLGSETSIKALPAISFRVPILMYHYVEYVKDPKDKIRISLHIPPNVFESQSQTLQENGYTFITASDIDSALAGKVKLPPRPILITFDDGYRDFYTDVFPILKKRHVKATLYVIVGFLDRPNHLLKSQLQELAGSGLVEIGAHTMNHLWLRGGNYNTVKYEIAESRKELQAMLNLPINSFAYPFGAFDNQAIQAVKDAGFMDAMSTVPGIQQSQDNAYFLYRLRPGWRTGQELITYLSKDTFKPW